MICGRCGQGIATNVLTIWCGALGRQFSELWCLPCLRRFLAAEGHGDIVTCDREKVHGNGRRDWARGHE